MTDRPYPDDRLPTALLALVLFLVGLFGIVYWFNCSEPQVTFCGCGHDDSSEVQELQDDEPFETAAKRKIRKVWFAGGAPTGLTEADFQRRVMSALSELSEFTNTDFVQSASSGGAYVRVYVATNEMMCKWFPKWAPGKSIEYPNGAVPLAAQRSNMVYYTIVPRWGEPKDRNVEGVTLHEFGHRFGIPHSSDKTSVMHIDMPVYRMNANDRSAFTKKLGKKLTRIDSKPLGLAA